MGGHKATIRGKLIQIASQIIKERALDVEKLERDFSALCKQHKKNLTKVQIAQLDAARIALNLALTVKAETSLHWSGARFYQQKDKMSKMLATKLSPKTCTFTLPKIRLQDDSMTLNPQRILH